MKDGFAVFVLALASASLFTASPRMQNTAAELVLPLRSRLQPFKSSNTWDAVTIEGKFPVSGSAIIVCDMWDRHWCSGANTRVAELARRMNPVLIKARAAGILIIHAPSETMDFYKDYPQRQFALSAPKVDPPAELKITDP